MGAHTVLLSGQDLLFARGLIFMLLLFCMSRKMHILTYTLVLRKHALSPAQVYALEVEEYMRDFSAPYFRRANVDQKAGPQMACMHAPVTDAILQPRCLLEQTSR